MKKDRYLSLAIILVAVLVGTFLVGPALRHGTDKDADGAENGVAVSESAHSEEASNATNSSEERAADESEAQDGKPQHGKNVKVGILQFMSHPSLDEIHQGILDGLKARGYDVGQNLEIVDLNGEGEQANLKMMSDQLIADGCDVVVGIATPAAQALVTASQDQVPVILAAVTDPVAAGLVDSVEKPGKNVTGTSDALPMSKQMDLIMAFLPKLQKIGFLYTTSEPASQSQIAEAEAYMKEKGIETETQTIATTNDLAQVAEKLAGGVDAIFVPNDNTIATAMNTLIPVTDAQQIPVFVPVASMVEEGGLATTGVIQRQIGVDTASMIADVLEGADARNTPVMLSISAETYVNTQKAEQLGIAVPEKVREHMVEVEE